MVKKIILGLLLLWVSVALFGCSSGGYPMVSQGLQMRGNAPWTTTTVGSSKTSQTVNITIKDVTTPEGSEPAFVGSNGVGSAVLFTIKAGTQIQVVINNQDSMPHTFTVGNLSISESIAPLAVTKFKLFVSSPGTYSWNCEVPCGDWVMNHIGYMKGSFNVVG
jgi:plastocyanin